MQAEPIPFSELLSAVVDNRGRTCPTTASGIPLIATNCIRNDLLYPALEKLRFVSQDTYDTWFRGHPEPGDLIFVTKGSPGRVCVAPDPVNFCIAQDMVAIRADETKVQPKYLFALLRSEGVQRKIEQMHVGTLIPHFKKSDFDQLILPVPDRNTQRVIGDIYFDLSAKIELNRRMNETLGAVARAIFRSWFVDFDPVRAKSEGREPAGMNAETAALFPSELEKSALVETPKGWKVVEVGAALELAYGKGLREEERRPGPVPVYGSNGQVGWHDEALVPGPGIVVGRKGNPGTVRWTQTDFFPIDTTFYVVPKEVGSLTYLFHTLSSMNLPSLAADSAVPGLNRNLAYMSDVLKPANTVLEAFDRIVAPLYGKIHKNDGESRTLASLRGALLPKLLSGTARLREAESSA